MKNNRKLIGEIGVDAGMCWIGDPCYIFGGNRPKEIGEDWQEFCEILDDKGMYTGGKTAQFNYDLGHAGLGVVTSTGWGDGCYPVYATFNKEGRVAKIEIEFLMGDWYEHVFEKQLEVYAEPDDLLVVFSCSGTSPNMKRAMQVGVEVVMIFGADGETYQAIENRHMCMAHEISEKV